MKPKMELGKIPPHDIDAEQAVLGSMLTDRDAVNAAIETLKEDSGNAWLRQTEFEI